MKPPYRIPTMAEIAALPRNGLSVVSTFSGCGGSSLGYRMAGFSVRAASEFVEAARATYRANFPETPVDERDIRNVSGAELLALAGLAAGELDLLDGSPPCAAFSTAGKREKGWNTVKEYSDTKQRTDDLFFEFARLVEEIRPRAFVAENVSGLVRGTAKGYFLEILEALKAPGYVVEARLLDASRLGVPQSRQRLIFVGVRADLGKAPAHPTTLAVEYSIADAIPEIAAQAREWEARERAARRLPKRGANRPAPVAARSDFPKEMGLEGYAVGREWDRLKPGETSERYFNLVRPDPLRPCPTITALGGQNAGVACVTHPFEKRKFTIPELRRLCGFPDDFVLTGDYPQQYERLGRAVPPPMMYRVARAVAERVFEVPAPAIF